VLMAEVASLLPRRLSAGQVVQMGRAWDRGRWEALKGRLRARHAGWEEVAG
jgi:hypothetical protein